MNLPPPDALERICKGLAVLDAILCEAWELRHFSFNAEWDAIRGERMASMRTGDGDTWFIVIDATHAFLKAFWHEHPRSDADTIYEGLPAALEPQRREPAFSMEDITFGGWYEPRHGWTLRGTLEPFHEELSILTGAAEVYRAYAASYFEVDVPLDAITHVLTGNPLDAALVARIAPERSLESLQGDLEEIGY
jgi:hypothetical protein